MVGRLSLQDVPELVDTKKKGDGVLDSPDSGLPPSPSPGHWGLAAAGGGGERSAAPGTLEPDAAASPAAPVSGPARPLPSRAHPQPAPRGPPRPWAPPPSLGTAWPPRGARGGSAARAGPAGVGGWKLVIAREARPPPLLGVAAPAVPGCGAATLPRGGHGEGKRSLLRLGLAPGPCPQRWRPPRTCAPWPCRGEGCVCSAPGSSGASPGRQARGVEGGLTA